VNGIISLERVKGKRKSNVVRNVDESAINLPLHDDAPNVPAGGNE